MNSPERLLIRIKSSYKIKDWINSRSYLMGYFGCFFLLKMDYQITAIKAQKRNPNRVNIFLDGRYAFSLARVIAVWLKIRQLINDEKIEFLKKQDSEEKALQKALYFISYRPRSKKEVRSKLETAGYDEELIERVLKRLIDAEVLDDDRFARAWVENRCSSHPRSKRLMSIELRHKGIDEEIIQIAITQGAKDEQLALAAAKKRFHRFDGLEYPEFRKKMSGFLMRRGFDYGIIIEVIDQTWKESQTQEAVNLQK